MKNIVVTGFESFLKNDSNPTQKLIKKIKDSSLSQQVDAYVLPVVFNTSAVVADELIRDQYKFIIHLGLSERTESFNLEKIAINWLHCSLPDNQSQFKTDELICEAGPNAIFTNFDILDLHKKLKDKNFPVKISLSAGSYVCNEVYYNSLLKYKKQAKVLFIHIPPFSTDEKSSFSEQNQFLFIRSVLEYIVAQG